MSSTSSYLEHRASHVQAQAHAQAHHAPPPPPPPPPLPPLPPPAPPLPPQRYGQRAATAIARLAHPFIYSSRPPSPQGQRDSDPGTPSFRHSSSIARNSSPLSSKSTTHKTGIPIAALDISGDRTHAILAGRDILKTIRVHDATCAEDFNLRSAISAYASTHIASRDAVSAQHRDQLAAYDVKWSRGNFGSTIATAAANGRIVVYDVNRPNVEVARLHEHTRQVHRLAFNAYQGALLLSGSQDGTVRMWDMRDLRGERSVKITGSIKRFLGNSDGVRDIRWSPTDGVEFASGTDSGAVQRWDFRKENAPVLKINAHDKTCLSVDWHPSGRYLASGGVDKNIKVWDFKSTDRRMKPSWVLRAPQAVSHIRWRPVDKLPGEKDSDGRQTTYLASSYDGKDPRIHLWDFRRPFIPFQEIDKYETPPTDMLWHSEDRLWTVGTAGMFTQTDMNFSPKPLDRQSVNVITTAPNGQLCYFAESRPRRHISIAEAEEHFLRRVNTNGSSGEKLSGSHSATDGSLEETSVLSAALRGSRPKAANAPSSSSKHTGNSQRYDTRSENAATLDPVYTSTQVASYGHVVGVFDVESFKYLARHYELPSLDSPSTIPQINLLTDAFEHNANLAAQTGQYRLAQTWRILGRAARKDLTYRKRKFQSNNSVTYTKLSRTAELSSTSPPPMAGADAKAEAANRLKAALLHNESSSNVPTPLARPAQGLPSVPSSEEHLLDQEHKVQSVSFKEPAWHNNRETDHTGNVSSQASKRGLQDIEQNSSQQYSPSDREFSDFERQMQERRSAMSNYKARPRAVFRLDDPNGQTQSLGVMPRLDRHDSTESFQMFSASSDSEPRSLTLAESFGESQRSNISDSVFDNISTSASQRFAYGNSVLPLRMEVESGQDDVQRSSDSLGSQTVPELNFEPSGEYDQYSAFLSRPYSPVRRPSNILEPNIWPPDTISSKKQTAFDAPRTSPPWASDDDSKEGAVPEMLLPWSLASLLPPVLDYHLTTLSDSQFPSMLALFLGPLYPNLFNAPALISSYLLAYHSHLSALQLHTEAASFRNACFTHFPDVATAATQGPAPVGFWCQNCRKPVKGNLDGWCARCCGEWGACPICELADPPPDSWLSSSTSKKSEDREEASSEPHGTRLWAWCQGCGHGGHSSCLREWWRSAGASAGVGDGTGISGLGILDNNEGELSASNINVDEGGGEPLSEGACPVPGCAHDCVPGLQRNLRLRQLERERRRSRASVLRDDWAVGESRAVERTRGLVGGGGGDAPSAAAAAAHAAALRVVVDNNNNMTSDAKLFTKEAAGAGRPFGGLTGKRHHQPQQPPTTARRTATAATSGGSSGGGGGAGGAGDLRLSGSPGPVFAPVPRRLEEEDVDADVDVVASKAQVPVVEAGGEAKGEAEVGTEADTDAGAEAAVKTERNGMDFG